MKQLRRGFHHLKENSKLHILDFRFIFRFRDLFKPLEAFEVELVLCAKYTKYGGSEGSQNLEIWVFFGKMDIRNEFLVPKNP